MGPDQAIIPTRRLHPGVSDILLSILADKVRQSDGRLLEALFIPAEIRVLRRLVELVDLFGEADRPLTIPLRQEDRASLAGTSRATVNRVLRAEENAVRSRCFRKRRGFVSSGGPSGRKESIVAAAPSATESVGETGRGSRNDCAGAVRSFGGRSLNGLLAPVTDRPDGPDA